MKNLFYLLLFCLPFELPIVQVSYGLFERRIGLFYLVVSATVPLCVIAWMIVAAARSNPTLSKYWFFATLYLAVGLAAVVMTPFSCSAANQEEQVRLFALQQLLFGYLTPVGIGAAILSLTPADQTRACGSFYRGLCRLFGTFDHPLADDVPFSRARSSEFQPVVDLRTVDSRPISLR